MSLMQKSLFVGVAAFVAYCIYFDRKRRSDPEFRTKLKQKRMKQKRSKEQNQSSEIPLFKSPSESQEFFLGEIQKSDESMMNGDFEQAAYHLANAAVVCSQKQEFLAAMQKTLPQPIFQLLLQYYQLVNERYLKKVLASGTLGPLINKVNTQSSSNLNVSSSAAKQFDDTDIE